MTSEAVAPISTGHAGRDAGPDTTDEVAARIVEAALACFTNFGVSKTTFEDIARAAGCSRATVYRYFPGKQALLDGVVKTEIRRLSGGLDAVSGDASSLDDLLTGILCHVGREFDAHEALRHVLEVEPEVVLPHVVFDGAERLFAIASAVLTPHLLPFLGPDVAARTAEWMCRIAITYLFSPSEKLDLTDHEAVRRFVRTFVLPGITPGDDADPIGTDLGSVRHHSSH